MTSPVVPHSATQRRRPVRALALGLLALVTVGGLAVAGRFRKNEAAPVAAPTHRTEAPAAQEVGVEVVSARALRQPIRVTGTIRTDETVTLSTKATGVVRRVLAKEGDRVRRGQLLVEIDASDLLAQRDRATAAVRAAQSQVAQAVAGVRSAEARLQQSRTGRTIKNAAAEADFRRAEQTLEAARARLKQTQAQSRITNTESETRVASARAGVQAARERLNVLREGTRRQERASAESAVARAQSQVGRMKSALDRREMLLREGAIAAEAVDNARRDYEVALTDLETARQQLSLALEGPRSEEIRAQEEVVRQAEAGLREAEANRGRREISDEDIEAAQAQVRQAEAALGSARVNLTQREVNEDEIRNMQAALTQARASVQQAEAAVNQARADVRYQNQLISQTRIYSPVNGVVTKRSVQSGAAVVQMRNELMTLVSADTLYFEATAPETSLPQLREGLPAQVILDAIPGKIFPGVVRQIIPVAEGTNRSVRLRISFPRPDRRMAVVGGFARAQIMGEAQQATVSVPRTAIASDEGEMAVFVVEGGIARHRKVTIGDPGGTGDRLPVLEGLRGGEQVVTEGASGLTDGAAVRVVPAGSRTGEKS